MSKKVNYKCTSIYTQFEFESFKKFPCINNKDHYHCFVESGVCYDYDDLGGYDLLLKIKPKHLFVVRGDDLNDWYHIRKDKAFSSDFFLIIIDSDTRYDVEKVSDYIKYCECYSLD